MKVVKIKTWEEMEEEFGINSQGNILTEYTFTKYMERQMPEDRIIEVYENGDWNGWSIDTDMIDSVISETQETEDED